ncbi:MAG: hypothetical protein ACLSUW_09125 [Akkermansia sp.]
MATAQLPETLRQLKSSTSCSAPTANKVLAFPAGSLFALNRQDDDGGSRFNPLLHFRTMPPPTWSLPRGQAEGRLPIAGPV